MSEKVTYLNEVEDTEVKQPLPQYLVTFVDEVGQEPFIVLGQISFLSGSVVFVDRDLQALALYNRDDIFSITRVEIPHEANVA